MMMSPNFGTSSSKYIRIIPLIMENGEYHQRYNKELQQDFGDQNIVSVIVVNYLRWVGHVAMMGDERVP
jgi:hypothetical protein